MSQGVPDARAKAHLLTLLTRLRLTKQLHDAELVVMLERCTNMLTVSRQMDDMIKDIEKSIRDGQ